MRLAALLVSLGLLGCGQSGQEVAANPDNGLNRAAVASPIQTGADVLAQHNFEELKGLRVGLIANQTTRTGGRHLADILAESPDVNLVALFGPEHGLRGDADAGAAVSDGRDRATGVPIYSLYGERRAPEPAVLAELDILVFDVQDIGARFYTYIATMGLAMQAASEAGIPFLVLDRPNPLGGIRVDGYVLETPFESFVGPYRIPIQHGLTVGELARMIVGEEWIASASTLDLRIVEVQGWSRDMLWPDLGADWIPTSPNIPNFETALVYPGMCLLEATTLNEGRGTETPFLVLGGPDINGPALAAELNVAGLAGVRFEPTEYAPVSIPGKSSNPRHLGTRVSGVSLHVTDPKLVRPLALGIYVLSSLVDQLGARVLRGPGLARLGGTDRLLGALESGVTPDEIVNSWSAEVQAFETLRGPYLLYR